MKRIILVFLALMSFTFTASCFASHDVRIGFYGDSTAYGTTMKADGTYYRTRDNEPDLIEWTFQQRYGNHVFVENHGVPGSICSDFLWGQNGVSHDWRSEISSAPADIIVFNTGINDAGKMTNNDFTFCYQQIAVIAQQAGKIFVIASPNPVNFSWNSSMWNIQHLEQAIVQQLNLTFDDHWTTLQANYADWITHLPDGIHPDPSGYGIKASHSVDVLDPLVSNLLNR